MSRKIFAILATLCIIVTVFGLALAATPDGNFRKGKYLFRKHCRTCHISGGEASDLSPADKPQAQWIELYSNPSAIPCNDKWEGLSEEDVKDIFTYMHDFAKDSPSPAKCS